MILPPKVSSVLEFLLLCQSPVPLAGVEKAKGNCPLACCPELSAFQNKQHPPLTFLKQPLLALASSWLYGKKTNTCPVADTGQCHNYQHSCRNVCKIVKYKIHSNTMCLVGLVSIFNQHTFHKENLFCWSWFQRFQRVRESKIDRNAVQKEVYSYVFYYPFFFFLANQRF